MPSPEGLALRGIKILGTGRSKDGCRVSGTDAVDQEIDFDTALLGFQNMMRDVIVAVKEKGFITKIFGRYKSELF